MADDQDPVPGEGEGVDVVAGEADPHRGPARAQVPQADGAHVLGAAGRALLVRPAGVVLVPGEGALVGREGPVSRAVDPPGGHGELANLPARRNLPEADGRAAGEVPVN